MNSIEPYLLLNNNSHNNRENRLIIDEKKWNFVVKIVKMKIINIVKYRNFIENCKTILSLNLISKDYNKIFNS